MNRTKRMYQQFVTMCKVRGMKPPTYPVFKQMQEQAEKKVADELARRAAEGRFYFEEEAVR